MTILAPNYYFEFKCIADRCAHSCCIGWEIDIDSHTYDLYTQLPGNLGNKLRQNIVIEDNQPRFLLCSDERCPFLTKNGLCEIIVEMGETALCNICNDHPRFRNYFSAHTEIGLGMCCEEAARLILSQKSFFPLMVVEGEVSAVTYTEDEKSFFEARERIFGTLSEKNTDIEQKIDKIKNEFSISLPDFSFGKWCDVFLSLERLDDEWTIMLEHTSLVKRASAFPSDELWQNAAVQLIAYFIYRHLGSCIYDSYLSEYIGLCLLSFYMIEQIYLRSEDKSFENFVDICRMYSSEIEYSDENIDELLFIISTEK